MAEVEPWSCQPQGYLLPQPGRDGGEGTGLTRTLGDFAAERRAQLSPQVSRSRSLPLGTVLISLPAGLRGVGGGGRSQLLEISLAVGLGCKPTEDGLFPVSLDQLAARRPSQNSNLLLSGYKESQPFMQQTNGLAHSLCSCSVLLVYQAAGASGSWVRRSWCFPW